MQKTYKRPVNCYAFLVKTFVFGRPHIELQYVGPVAGVNTEKIRKGRVLAGLTDIWRVFLEILPLHKSKERKFIIQQLVKLVSLC